MDDTDNLIARFCKEKQLEDEDYLHEYLADINEFELQAIDEWIPVLLQHKDWLIRVDVLETIGDYCLKQFKNEVIERLDDEDLIVALNAVRTLYDLDPDELWNREEKLKQDDDRKIGAKFELLRYIHTDSEESLAYVENFLFNEINDEDYPIAVLNTLLWYDAIERDAVQDFIKKIIEHNDPDSPVVGFIEHEQLLDEY